MTGAGRTNGSGCLVVVSAFGSPTVTVTFNKPVTSHKYELNNIMLPNAFQRRRTLYI